MKNSERAAYPGTRAHGLTKREYFAAMAMQGFISNSNTKLRKYEDVVNSSIGYADELLKQLEE